MLLRTDEAGVLAIGQPSHAWVSGQLARAWGNEHFGEVFPRAQVCLAADQHDIGMGAWDMAPTLNPDSGLPYGFTEMPLELHLEQWRDGPQRVLAHCRYAGLLVSMHGMRLYERRDLSKLPEREAELVQAYLADQRALQAKLRASLAESAEAEAAAAVAAIERNSQLLWTWDYLSLALCLDWAPGTAHAVPTAESPVELELEPLPAQDGLAGRIQLDPWPFREPAVVVRAEGRRLAGRFDDEPQMRAALENAPWESLRFELCPA